MPDNTNYIVAIAGPVGGGKTSLVNGIAATLKDSMPIFFDHYEQITAKSMESIRKWMQEGTVVDEFSVPQLTVDLQRLKRGESIRHPQTQLLTPASKYVLFETPFGRLHRATAEQIDLMVWIDTPLDIALARKSRELVGIFLNERPLATDRDSLAWLHGYFSNYVEAIGSLLKLQQNRVGSQADVVVDGQLSQEELIPTTIQAINHRLP